MSVDIQIPRKYAFLLTEEHDYKVLYGGRNAARGWSVAQALLASGISKVERVLCAREIQKSIDESVHQLLADQIQRLNMGFHYQVQNKLIRGYNGTLFRFSGLRYNTSEFKSKESITKLWIEEAHNVSKYSYNTVIPTIRADGSEVWVTFNPELETDYTYELFVKNPPASSKVVFSTWRDNPWISAKALRDKDDLMQRDYDEYLVYWEGQPRSSLQNAVFKAELQQAQLEQRICRVPYDPTAPVHTYWDLGYGDHTSIWFAQRVGMQWRMLRFYENSNEFLPHYVQKMHEFGYVYGTHYLPHDGNNNQLGGESIKAQLEKMMPACDLKVGTKEDPTAGIQAARLVFPTCWFDADNCFDGLQSLRHYKWKTNKEGIVVSREPLHDEWSDGADAFRTFAMARNRDGKKHVSSNKYRSRPQGQTHSKSWMGA